MRRLRDLYLGRILLVSSVGRIPEAVRPYRLEIERFADEYAQRLDQLDAAASPVVAEEVALCEHVDLIVGRDDDSPQTG